MKMLAAMLLRQGPVANNARQSVGRGCNDTGGADDNSKRRERAADDGAAA